MKVIELLTFNELKEKISEMEEVLKILKSDANIATKNYLLIERILSKNNIEMKRSYDCVNDVLELQINCSEIKMCSKALISNYTCLEDAEMTILINLYRALKDISVLLKTTKYEMVIDADKRNNFEKIFNDIDEILLPNHDEIATGIAYYILNDIFEIGNDIRFSDSDDPYQFVTFGDNYCGFKYGISTSIYILMTESPYSILNFILNKVVFKKRTILSRALYNEININYFITNGFKIIFDSDKIIEIYNNCGNSLARIMLDDSEYSKAAVFFDNFIPRTWEFLDAISFYAHMVEIKYNKYLKDVK